MNKTKSKFSVKKLMVGLAAGVLALLLAAFGAVWMICQHLIMMITDVENLQHIKNLGKLKEF